MTTRSFERLVQWRTGGPRTR